MGRRHGRSVHRAGTQETTVCGEVERGRTYGKGHQLQEEEEEEEERLPWSHVR